jgi:hypothetical protein
MTLAANQVIDRVLENSNAHIRHLLHANSSNSGRGRSIAGSYLLKNCVINHLCTECYIRQAWFACLDIRQCFVVNFAHKNTAAADEVYTGVYITPQGT